MKSMCASFEDVGDARKAARELIDAGMSASQIRLADGSPDGRAVAKAQPREEDLEFGAVRGTFPDLIAQGPGYPNETGAINAPGTRGAYITETAYGVVDPGVMTDYLWSLLPDDLARRYRDDLDGGKSVLVVEDPAPGSETILRNHHAVAVHSHVKGDQL